VADGVIVPIGITREYVEYTRHHVGEGLRAAARTAGDIGIIYLFGCSIAADRDVARAESRTSAAKRALAPVPVEVSGVDRAEAEAFTRAYRYQEHMDVDAGHARLVPEHWIDRFTPAGTAADVRAKVADLEAWGVHHLALLPTTRRTQSLITVLGETTVANGANPSRRIR
jgi:hypothetical protein